MTELPVLTELPVMRGGLPGKIASVVAIVLSLFQLYIAGFGTFEALTIRSVHLGFILVLTFLWLRPVRKPGFSRVLIAIDIVLALAAVAFTVYLMANMEIITTRMRYVDPVSVPDIIFGLTAIVLVLEGTRRAAGSALTWVTLVALAYAAAGPILPSAIGHAGITLQSLIEQMYLLTDGIYGIPLGAAATYIFLFIVLGSVMEKTGIGGYFLELASFLTGRARGGPAKIAIIASALFGSVSGSAPANVYAIGVWTIPLMKRVGYSSLFAGAVEAVASTGGQIMPPVMGAAAFIMADIIGVPYVRIIQAALIPALLYYGAVFAQVHFRAIRLRLGGLSSDELPAFYRVLGRSYLLLPLVFLIVSIVIGRSVMMSALYAIPIAWLVSLVRKETRMGVKGFALALINSAQSSLMISTATAASGIVIGVVLMTNVGFKLINAITLIGQGSFFLSLVMTMVASLVLGIGVPTAAAYVIVAILAVPGLINLGVPLLSAHMFVFYFAIISVITPPVALAAFAAASISGAPMMATGWAATRLGLAAFVIPFIFVYQPVLLWQGDIVSILLAAATASVGVIAIGGGIEGWFVGRANLVQRILLLGGGFALVYPGWKTDLIGLVTLAIIALWQWRANRNGHAITKNAGGHEQVGFTEIDNEATARQPK